MSNLVKRKIIEIAFAVQILATFAAINATTAFAQTRIEISPGDSLQITREPLINFTPVTGVTVTVTGKDSAHITARLDSFEPIFGTLNIRTKYTLKVASDAPLGELTITVLLDYDGAGVVNLVISEDFTVVTGVSPVLTADFSGTPTKGLAPLPVQFTDQSTGNITSRQWNFGDGQSSTAPNPSHTYTAVGNYTVSLTVSGPNGSNTKTRQNYITISRKTSANVNLTFQCDMSVEILSGLFNPVTDRLSMRGSFNNWSNIDLMAPVSDTSRIYTKAIRIFATVGDTLEYKFAHVRGNTTTWEAGANRKYGVTQSNIDTEAAQIKRPFNDLDMNNVTAQPTIIKFTVDMKNAVDKNGTAFPKIENVVIAGAVPPLQWPGAGWPDSDKNKTIALNDNGTGGDKTAGDEIWSIDITFPAYTAFRIQYLYGANWGLPSNNGRNDNEAVFENDHFISLSQKMLSATVRNKFGTMGEHQLEDIKLDITTISLLSPNGGENWEVGSLQNVTWSASNVNFVRIEYSYTGGGFWITVADSVPASTGSYSWTVPNNQSGSCLVRVFDVSAPSISDVSENPFTIMTTTDVADNESEMPEHFVLHQNYPNPFNPTTTIRFALPKAGRVALKIYDLLGREISTLVDEYRPAGEHEFTWSPADLSSGIYLYRLQAGEFVETKKFILQK